MKILKLLLYLVVGLTLLNLVYADCPTCQNGLIAYWDFNGDAVDSSGNGNDGTVNGAILTSGVLGQAYEFDGADDYVNFTSSLPPGSATKLTVSKWFKLDNYHNNYRGIWGKYISDSSRIGEEVYKDGSLYFVMGNGANGYSYSPPGTISLDQWYHTIIVYDGDGASNDDKVKVYVNGVNQSLIHDNIPSSLFSSSLDFKVGDSSVTGIHAPFDGIVDEVSIWDRALNPTEISQLYNSGVGLDYPFGCGDGSAVGGEECDDADGNDVDLCSNTCEDNSPVDGKFDTVSNYATSEDLTNQSDFELTLNSGSVKWNNPVHILQENLSRDINLGSGFISMDFSNLNETFNSSANISFTVDGCDTYQIYYSPSGFFSDYASLKADSNTVACPGEICSDVSCVGNTLSFTALHFDGFGGEGSGSGVGVPEFNAIGIVLILGIVGLGMYFISKRN